MIFSLSKLPSVSLFWGWTCFLMLWLFLFLLFSDHRLCTEETEMQVRVFKGRHQSRQSTGLPFYYLFFFLLPCASASVLTSVAAEDFEVAVVVAANDDGTRAMPSQARASMTPTTRLKRVSMNWATPTWWEKESLRFVVVIPRAFLYSTLPTVSLPFLVKRHKIVAHVGAVSEKRAIINGRLKMTTRTLFTCNYHMCCNDAFLLGWPALGWEWEDAMMPSLSSPDTEAALT